VAGTEVAAMMLTRVPGSALRPFVRLLWASDEGDAPRRGLGARAEQRVSTQQARELVLPTGTMHLALRLSDTPLALFDAIDAPHARTVSTSVVGGARASFYVRDVSQPVTTVGAQLEPGTAALLLGVPADELAGRHTPLDALWGHAVVERLRDQLAAAPSLECRLLRFEQLLFARLPRLRGLHPAVVEGLVRLARADDVAGAVSASGYSHRHFGNLFRAAVGLSPKLFCRVQRFELALAQAAQSPRSSWSALAQAAGYSDQAHFNRDFRDFAGLTPGRYRALAPRFSHHVPLAP
jgi:AraC-like DNA-binding protein